MVSEKLTCEQSDDEMNDLLLNHFKMPFVVGYIKRKGCVLSKYFLEFEDRIKKLEIRDDDIFVCTFPKSGTRVYFPSPPFREYFILKSFVSWPNIGTTWTQEMVWCIAHDVDLEAAKKDLLSGRFPVLELTASLDYRGSIAENPNIIVPSYVLDSVKYINELPSPRFVKTHLPFDLLPEKLQNNSTRAQIIYVMRNPRDACVSYYHHSKLFYGYKGSFEQYAQLFLEGNVLYGSYPNNLKGYWQQKNNPNILFVRYDDMKTDLKSVIYKVANFIGKSINENNIDKLVDHLSFSNMKQNRAVNFEPAMENHKKYKLMEEDGSFMRKGEIGDWKEIMDSDLCKKFEKWENENLDGIEFTFSV